jgi:hypothetical protein
MGRGEVIEYVPGSGVIFKSIPERGVTEINTVYGGGAFVRISADGAAAGITSMDELLPIIVAFGSL